jgi:hypothetical protein
MFGLHRPVMPLEDSVGTDYERLYREGVIERLDKLDKRFDELSTLLGQRYIDTGKEISELRTDLSVVEAVLRIKAGIWGASSGLAAGLMMVLIFLLTKLVK